VTNVPIGLPRFIGRSEALEALRLERDAALKGEGRITLVVGESGVGKSTLLGELAREDLNGQVRILRAEAPALDGPPPFALLRSAFEGKDADVFPSVESRTEGASAVASGVLANFVEQAGASPQSGIEQRLLRALDDEEARGARARRLVFARIARRLFEMADSLPTVLLVDDLHRGDDSSLATLEFMADQIRHHRLWILAASRPPASLSNVPRARLEQFERTVRERRVELPAFTKADLAEFLRTVERDREFTPDEIAQRFEQSRGNAALVEQFARRRVAGLAVRGLPRPGDPPISPEAQRVLGAAAVIGSEFTLDLLMEVSGDEETAVRKAVDEFVSQGILLDRRDGRLEFPDDRRRDAVYAQLGDEARRVLHRRAGRVRELAWRRDRVGVFNLARDFYLGGVEEKSIEYNQIAAEISEAAAAPDLARDFIFHALESQRERAPTDLRRESELVLDLARVTYETGRLDDAERILREFLGRIQASSDFPVASRHALQIYLIRVLSAQGELGLATELAKSVLGAPEIREEPWMEIAARGQLALSLYFLGQYSQALEENAKVGSLAASVGDARGLARAGLWRAGCLAMVGDADQALVEARKAAASFERLGTVGEAAQGHLFLGNMLADNRSTPAIRREAVVELELAIRLGESAHDPRRVGWAYYHLAELLRFERRLRESEENARKAISTLEQIGDRVGQAVSLKVRGQIEMEQGELVSATSDLEEARRLLAGLHSTLNEVDVLLRLAQLAVLKRELGDAKRLAGELETLQILRVRPDLSEEFQQLSSQLDPPGNSAAPG
jgi:tetratricopeptide (TPR) repeat protein